MSETRVLGISKQLQLQFPVLKLAHAWMMKKKLELDPGSKTRLVPTLYRRPKTVTKTWDVSVSIQPDNFFRPEKMTGLFVKEQLQRVTVCPESCLSCFLTLEPFFVPHLFPGTSLGRRVCSIGEDLLPVGLPRSLHRT